MEEIREGIIKKNYKILIGKTPVNINAIYVFKKKIKIKYKKNISGVDSRQ